MVLVEAHIFRGDDRMLKVARDLAQRNEFVSLEIRLVLNPCLQAPLHVHGGGRRVDPPGSHKNQHSNRPKQRHSDKKPPEEGSEGAFPMWSLGGYVWIFSHTSE